MTHLIAMQQKSGEAICEACVINNVRLDERRYPIEDHVVTLDGQPEPILEHDYLALVSMPGGLYRPMAPSEQNALRKRKEAQSSIEE